jgi:hypothetical protein
MSASNSCPGPGTFPAMTGSSWYSAYPGCGDVVVCRESARAIRADPCDNFLYSFKGAPRRAGPDGLDMNRRKREQAGRERYQSQWPAVGAGVRAGQLAVGGAAASVTPFGRKPAGRVELPRRAARVTDRIQCPPYRPGTASVHEHQADGFTRVAQSPERCERWGRVMDGRQRDSESPQRRTTFSHMRWSERSRLVVRGGVEPPTFRFSGGRSYQLSYLTVGADGNVALPKAVLTGFEPATFTLTG